MINKINHEQFNIKIVKRAQLKWHKYVLLTLRLEV